MRRQSHEVQCEQDVCEAPVERTVAGLVFLQGCEARLRARMASLRPLKPLPDIFDYWRRAEEKSVGTAEVRAAFVAVGRGEAVDPKKIQDGWSARTRPRERRCSGRPGARPRRSASGSARGPKFLRSHPSSSFNAACQTRRNAHAARPMVLCSTTKMSRCQQVALPLARCLRQGLATQPAAPSIYAAAARSFSSTASRRDVETSNSSSSTPAADAQSAQELASTTPAPAQLKEQWLDPNTTTLLWAERRLLKQGTEPIGSRRRRAAVRQSPNIPFEQLPYHCFQEARKVLAEDRAEKLDALRRVSIEIAKLEQRSADVYRAGEQHKEKKLRSLREHLEELKIQADVNDPAVKRKWEDGLGKPQPGGVL